MDRETLLRKQLQDEMQAQYAAKLKDAKQGKLQAEEELETAAERWRSERRRLNLDIDRLESELVKAKEKSGKNLRSDAKLGGLDAVEVAKMRASADERLSKATKEWEVERARLISQSERLEKAVAEAIERSNNPLRSTQPVKEQFEQKVEEITRAKERVEDQFRRAQMDWDEEKLKLNGDLVKLRRAAAQTKTTATRGKADSKSDDSEELHTRISTLETELRDATRTKAQLQTQIEQLERTVSETQGRTTQESVDQLKRDHEDRIQLLTHEKTQLSKELEAVSKSFEAERERLKAEARTTPPSAKDRTYKLETEVAEITDDRDRLAKELKSLRRSSEDERERLETEFAKALRAAKSQNDSVADERVAAMESELAEMTAAKERAAKELNAVRTIFEKERERFAAEIENAADSAKSQPDSESAERVTILESQLADETRAREKAAKELDAIRTLFEEERERFAAEIENAADSAKSQHDADGAERLAIMESQLAEATRAQEDGAKELGGLRILLEEERERFAAEIVKAADSAKSQHDADNAERVTILESQLAEATRAQDDSAKELGALRILLEEERERFAAEIAKAADSAKSQHDADSAERVAIMESQLADETRAREKAAKELDAVRTLFEEERERFAAEIAKAADSAKSQRDSESAERMTILESQLAEATRAQDDGAKELGALRILLEEERERFAAEIASAATSAAPQQGSDSDDRVTILESQLADETRAREKTAKELDAVRTLFEEERERFAAEIAKAAKPQQGSAGDERVAILASQLADATRAQEDGTKEIGALRILLEEERERFAAEIAKTTTSAVPQQGAGSDDRIAILESQLANETRAREKTAKELDAVRTIFEEERERFAAEIAKVAKAAKPQQGSAGDERVAILASQLAEANRAQEDGAKELGALRILLEEERERFAADLEKAGQSAAPVDAQWQEEQGSLQAQIQQLERTLSETREQVSNEIVDQLRRQYDAKLQDMIRQKTQLSQELEIASSRLEGERARLMAEIGNSGKTDQAGQSSDDIAIAAEVARVEALVREIGALIDDPETDLSTIIRKNVEKAELDAYLKGILFSMGRGKAMA